MEKRIVSNMIDAMNISKDDVVLLNYWGPATGLEDAKLFQSLFDEKGINYVTLNFTDKYVLSLVESYPEGLDDAWFEPVSKATLVIDLMDSPVGMPPAELAREKYPVFGAVLASLFGFMSQHEKMIQITMPTEQNAMVAGQSYEVFAKRITAALDVDYVALKEACENKLKEFNGNQRVITTGDGCQLTMDTTGREWQIDAGEGAFPCGEVYIAPLEEKTNGKIFLEKLAVEGLGCFDSVTLEIKDGRFVSSNCQQFDDFIKSIDEAGADVVAELGIGMNPNVAGIDGDSEVDENALGTFHIAFGMNHMFGGKNACRFHMDFVTTGDIR